MKLVRSEQSKDDTMKEKIYTIPVTDAFRTECECPMCVLEQDQENKYVDYTLGPSLMEPDGRIDTNEKGFCRKHFELLYNTQVNRLGLGLIIDTHLHEQNSGLKKKYEENIRVLQADAEISALKDLSARISSRQTGSEKFIDDVVAWLEDLENKCSICSKLDYTMERYTDVIFYLWLKEQDFRELFNSRKGFCLKHFKKLLIGAKKYLGGRNTAIFTDNLMKIQLDNLERIQQEVNWFTKKFDYRNNDASWGNSKDAVQRSIQKIAGYSNLK